MKTWFFGWNNIKWFIREITRIYTPGPSFFSKKRIESGVSFLIAQWGMIFFLLENFDRITMGEFLLWAAAEFTVAGYIIQKIEQAKKEEQIYKEETEEQINS